MARRFARAVVGRRGALAAARVERKCESCESEDLKQRAATGHRFGELVMSEPGDASERDAERMAQQAYATLTSRGAGAPVVPSVLGGARLQRAVDEQAAASPGGFIVDDEAAALLPG
jgi:hypothetical protein